MAEAEYYLICCWTSEVRLAPKTGCSLFRTVIFIMLSLQKASKSVSVDLFSSGDYNIHAHVKIVIAVHAAHRSPCACCHPAGRTLAAHERACDSLGAIRRRHYWWRCVHIALKTSEQNNG